MTGESDDGYRCPACHGTLTGSDNDFTCANCDRHYESNERYVDFLGDQTTDRTPIVEYLFETIPPIYENLYFPLLYRLGTLPEHYTPQDQAQELVERSAAQQGTVLDLACGTGRLTRKLAEVNRRVFALDRSGGMLTQAIESTPHTLADSIEFCRADAFKLPFRDDLFHATTCSGAFYFFPDLKQVLSELHRVLKTGSHLAGMTIVNEGILGNKVADVLRSLYNAIGTYEVHEVSELDAMLTTVGFEEFRHERHGSVLIFDAKKQ